MSDRCAVSAFAFFVACISALAPAVSAAPRSKSSQKGVVKFHVSIPEKSFVITTGTLPVDEGSLKVVQVHLEGVAASSPDEPGVPDLPVVYRFVALPAGAVIDEVTFHPTKSAVTQGVQLVGWTQIANPAQQAKPSRPPTEPVFFSAGKQILFTPSGDATPPSPELMKRPQWPATLSSDDGQVETIADTTVERIRLAPLMWEPQKATLTFYPDVDVEVHYSIGRQTGPPQKKLALADVIVNNDLRNMVVNPKMIPLRPWPKIQRPDAPYLIITDNFRWSASGQKKLPLDGDLVAEFQRFADWKTRLGLKAKVVTVSDIVAGRYGDFTTGSVDLPEILRRFIQHARRSWNTAWVLLGGTENIIPPRYVLVNALTNSAHYLKYDPSDTPHSGGYHFDPLSRTVRIHAPALEGVPEGRILSTRNSTIFDRVDDPTPSHRGWTFVTDDTYTTPSATPTEWAILRGRAIEVERTDFYIDLAENTIPTDLYYASVADPLYGHPGVHDWDANGDGYYGENSGGHSIDGVSFFPDVQVGRAPVETAAQAAAFVDRTIFYESSSWTFENPGPHALFASTDWGTAGPAADTLVYSGDTIQAGDFRVVDHYPNSPEVDIDFAGREVPFGGWDLVARSRYGTSWRIFSYNRNASPTTEGYYFTTDDTFTTRSEAPLDVEGIPFMIPIPTRFVKLFTHPESEIYFFDNFDPDGSATEQEQMIDIIKRSAPGITTTVRRYQDWFDLDPNEPYWALNASEVDPISLDFGFNIMSLSGHGSPAGCCGFNQYSDLGFSPSGLFYADSCLTNGFDAPYGSISEAFVGNDGPGGPIAYVGNTRYSWIGAGADLEKIFWEEFGVTSEVGTLFGTKALRVTDGVTVWQQYSLNLMGDPSVNLWRGRPSSLTLDAPETLPAGSRLRVQVLGGGVPLAMARVAVTGPNTFQVVFTDADGWAELDPLGLGAGPVTVVATAPSSVPADATVAIVPRD